MKNFSHHKLFRCSLVRVITAAVIVALANGFDGLGARAAMRLPEEAISLELSLLPSNVIPAVVVTALVHELPVQQDAPRRTPLPGLLKTSADRPRRQDANRINKRALAELLGLVSVPGVERAYVLPFEDFQNCRQFVAVNC